MSGHEMRLHEEIIRDIPCYLMLRFFQYQHSKFEINRRMNTKQKRK